MPLLAVTNLLHRYGDVITLDGVSLSVEDSERIGIVGRNGTGKSTLLKVITGDLKQDAGTVSLARGRRLGYLKQDPVFEEGETLRSAAEAAFAELHKLHQDLHAVFDRMGEAEGDALEKLLREQERLEKQIEAAGGYAIDHKIDEILHGLGFTDAQFGVPVDQLSGGQRARLALAKLLLEQPDVILLDEPTNHLDLAGRLWLESFLKDEFKGAVVMISHDRYLLDNVVSRIIEVEHARLIEYPGNYKAFRRLRAERREAQLRVWEKQQTTFKREEAFIRKFKAGQRAKQARGREARLDRAKQGAVERPMELSELRLTLPKAERTGDIVASVRGLTKLYPTDDSGEKVLFREFDLTIGRGERWGVIGPNGAGKTTLVRCLLGEQQPTDGKITLGSSVAIGHFSQRDDWIDPDKTLYRFIQKMVKDETQGETELSEQESRTLAGAFLFSGEEQEKEMGVLSGGERARARLAALLACRKNVLVLDEPTNHLDIPAAERLETALGLADPEHPGKRKGAFDGTLILISHDRALIDATCDRLIVLDGSGGADVFLGSYSEWRAREDKRARQYAEEAEGTRRPRSGQDGAAAKKAAGGSS
ncbi:MAG: ABC-F family ATP-binding cassette domain-containing protein, partial [Planctomycetota bacterium]